MVNRRMDPEFIQDQRHAPKDHRKRYGRYLLNVRFPEPLYRKIVAEAKLRGWTAPAMVRHLCEASIDGIE